MLSDFHPFPFQVGQSYKYSLDSSLSFESLISLLAEYKIFQSPWWVNAKTAIGLIIEFRYLFTTSSNENPPT